MTAALLSPGDVYDRTRIAKQTLANWRTKRTGPPYVKVGRLVRYPEDTFNAWLEEHTTSQA